MSEHALQGSVGGPGLRLGFGVSGALGSRLMSEQAVDTLLAAAYGAGLRFFDSAPFYGRAEARLGRFLTRHAIADAVIASKIGTVRRGGRLVKDWRPAFVSAQIERSRQALGGGPIDILFLHGTPPVAALPGLARALGLARESGAVRAIGLCSRWQEDWSALFAALPIEIVMAPFDPREPAHLASAAALVDGGRRLIAIETMRAAARSLRFTLRGADWWNNARLIRRRGLGAFAPADRTAPRPETLLAEALASPLVSMALMNTSEPRRLRSNVAAARRAS